ncbi:MAG: hypothetical protein OSB38_42250 [Paraburkholderia fungorum]|nr:hypothetical protein [Paraburkholderia fungorum]
MADLAPRSYLFVPGNRPHRFAKAAASGVDVVVIEVAAVNAAFIPGEKDVAWAQRVVEDATASHGAAVAVDGRMVDRPVILKAQEILAESQRRLPHGVCVRSSA